MLLRRYVQYELVRRLILLILGPLNLNNARIFFLEKKTLFIDIPIIRRRIPIDCMFYSCLKMSCLIFTMYLKG